MSVQNIIDTPIQFWRKDTPNHFVLNQEQYLTTAGKIAKLTHQIQLLKERIIFIKNSKQENIQAEEITCENGPTENDLRKKFLRLLGERRFLLDYLQINRPTEYQQVINFLNLKNNQSFKI